MDSMIDSDVLFNNFWLIVNYVFLIGVCYVFMLYMVIVFI